MGKPRTDRVFPAAMVPGRTYGHLIKCQCGAEEFYPVAVNSPGGWPVQVLAKKLTRAGWSVRRNGRDVLCNACAYGRKGHPAKSMAEAIAAQTTAPNPEPKKEPVPMNTPAAQQTAALAVSAAIGPARALADVSAVLATASRKQKREIMDFLTAHYDGTAWAGAWSDAKAAEKLGVPRVWVKEVRVEFFGDADTNAATAESRREAAELKAMAQKLNSKIEEAMGQLASFEGALAALTARISVYEKGI